MADKNVSPLDRIGEDLSAELVPLDAQDAAADDQDNLSVDATVELSDIQHGDARLGEEERLTEDQAVDAGNIIAEVVLSPARPNSDRLQDSLAFENARRDEAVAQGVTVTTQERLSELARQEEAEGQGVQSIGDTTQKRLFRESRAEEARAGKLEEHMHGAVEPLSVTTDGIDQVKKNKESAKESLAVRKAGRALVAEKKKEVVSP